MAKKPLRRPDLPPGSRLDLFLFLQDLVLRNEDPSVATISRAIPFSHQAIYKALTGPNTPSKHIVATLSEHLGGQDALVKTLEFWTAAVAEERNERSGSVHETTRKRLDSPARKEFAEALTKMFDIAGRPTMKQLERGAAASRSTIYNLLAGRTLSDWDTIQAVVRTLGSEPEGLKQLWTAARAEQAQGRRPARPAKTRRLPAP